MKNLIYHLFLRQYSSGEILLSSSNPHDHPLIDPKSLSHEEDLEDLVEAVKKSRNLFNQSALERFNAGEHAPGSKVRFKGRERNSDPNPKFRKKESQSRSQIFSNSIPILNFSEFDLNSNPKI